MKRYITGMLDKKAVGSNLARNELVRHMLNELNPKGICTIEIDYAYNIIGIWECITYSKPLSAKERVDKGLSFDHEKIGISEV
jgi:hypothetical protein